MAEKKSESKRKYSSTVLFLRDVGVALAFVAIVLLSLYAYTGLWPPLVVVESDSMMHGADNVSHIGTIDTGDLVLVKKVDGISDITTYMQGYVSGHRTYGDYGDVVIYKRDGSEVQTPIIHRAIIYLEANADGTSYRASALESLTKGEKWTTSDPSDTWDHLTSFLYINHVGWNDLTITIDIAHFIPYHRSGIITKGDHNPQIDQLASQGPVILDWIVGKARGEIPWFGLLKLWATGTLGSTAPANSVRDLWISIAVIVLAPIGVDLTLTYREKRAIAKKKAMEESQQEAPEGGEKRAEAGVPVEDTEEPPKLG